MQLNIFLPAISSTDIKPLFGSTGSTKAMKVRVSNFCSYLSDILDNVFKPELDTFKKSLDEISYRFSKDKTFTKSLFSTKKNLDSNLQQFEQDLGLYWAPFNKISESIGLNTYQINIGFNGWADAIISEVSSNHRKLENSFFKGHDLEEGGEFSADFMFLCESKKFLRNCKLILLCFEHTQKYKGKVEKNKIEKLKEAINQFEKTTTVKTIKSFNNVVESYNKLDTVIYNIMDKNEAVQDILNDYKEFKRSYYRNIKHFLMLKENSKLFKSFLKNLLNTTLKLVESSLKNINDHLEIFTEPEIIEEDNFEVMKFSIEEVYSEMFGLIGKSSSEIFYDEEMVKHYKLDLKRLQQRKEEDIFKTLEENWCAGYLNFPPEEYYVKHNKFDFSELEIKTEKNEGKSIKAEDGEDISEFLSKIYLKVTSKGAILYTTLFVVLFAVCVLITKLLDNLKHMINPSATIMCIRAI